MDEEEEKLYTLKRLSRINRFVIEDWENASGEEKHKIKSLLAEIELYSTPDTET